MTKTELAVPDEAWHSAGDAYEGVLRKFANEPWYTGDVNSVMLDAAMAAVIAAAPKIVAAELVRMAAVIEANVEQVAGDPNEETYRDCASTDATMLRARAVALRGGA